MNRESAVPLVSVIIPARNAVATLKQCLKAILSSSYPRFEYVVVDDGSTDETAALAREGLAQVISSIHSHGPAHARNLGARAAKGEILLFVDADVCISPRTIEQFVTEFIRHPEVDAVFGSYDDTPPEKNFISQYKNLFHHFTHQVAHDSASTFWSGCGAIRSEVFVQLGGFDESYTRPCIEDIDLGTRLKTAGGVILLKKDVQVKHLKRWTFWGLLKTDIRDRAIPWTRLMFRTRVFPNDLNLQWSQKASTILVYLLTLSVGWTLISWDALASASPWILGMPGVLLAFIVLINFPCYAFFARRKTPLFALGVIPLHLLYFLYSGFSFVLGAICFLAIPEKRDRRKRTPEDRTKHTVDMESVPLTKWDQDDLSQ